MRELAREISLKYLQCMVRSLSQLRASVLEIVNRIKRNQSCKNVSAYAANPRLVIRLLELVRPDLHVSANSRVSVSEVLLKRSSDRRMQNLRS